MMSAVRAVCLAQDFVWLLQSWKSLGVRETVVMSVMQRFQREWMSAGLQRVCLLEVPD